MTALLQSEIPGLPKPRQGKVREVYDLGDALLLVSTDRLSAFDVVMPTGIPDKGRILNQLSAFWFEYLASVCPHHMVSVNDGVIAQKIGRTFPDLAGRSMLCKKAIPLTIECVARGYITGSLFKEYRAHGRGVHGLDLPEGLIDGSRLSEPIFTPASKAESGHDENLSFSEAIDRVGKEIFEWAREKTLSLYAAAAKHAESVGLILADTKFEFGISEEGPIWIDEALTPDSSRYWEAALYSPGQTQPSFDKQYVRDYLETLDWNKQPPGPVLPQEIIENTRRRYCDAFARITGAPLAECF